MWYDALKKLSCVKYNLNVTSIIYFKIVKFKEMCTLEWKRKILRPKNNHIHVDSVFTNEALATKKRQYITITSDAIPHLNFIINNLCDVRITSDWGGKKSIVMCNLIHLWIDGIFDGQNSSQFFDNSIQVEKNI